MEIERYYQLALEFCNLKRLKGLWEGTPDDNPECGSLIKGWGNAQKRWQALPKNETSLFEETTGYPAGKRIAFKDLVLGNICGNIYEDYRKYEDWYIELHMSAAWSGPLYWLPRRQEVERFTQIAEAVHVGEGKPQILEIAAGTGLLSLLLARTNRLEVTAMDPAYYALLGKQVYHSMSGEININDTPAYNHPNLELLIGNSKAAALLFQDTPPDVVICSWMPECHDLTNDIVALKPKAVIYINPIDGKHNKNYRKIFLPKKGYQQAFSWLGISFNDTNEWWAYVNSERSNEGEELYYHEDLTFEDENFIEVHLRDSAPPLSIDDKEPEEKYPWEVADLSQILDADTYARFLQKPEKLVKLQAGFQRLLEVAPMQRF